MNRERSSFIYIAVALSFACTLLGASLIVGHHRSSPPSSSSSLPSIPSVPQGWQIGPIPQNTPVTALWQNQSYAGFWRVANVVRVGDEYKMDTPPDQYPFTYETTPPDYWSYLP